MADPVPMIIQELEANHETLLTKRDVYNTKQRMGREELGDKTPAEWLVDELVERDRVVRLEADNDGRFTRPFFAHHTSIKLFKQYADIAPLDCAYKMNRFNMPFRKRGGPRLGARENEGDAGSTPHFDAQNVRPSATESRHSSTR